MQSVFSVRPGIKDALFQNRTSFPLRGSQYPSSERLNRRKISCRKDYSFPISLSSRLGSDSMKCSSSPQTGIFPSGKKQPQLEVPAVILSVEAQDVLTDPEVLIDVSKAVAGGITAVLLREENASSAELYEAASLVQEKLRDRAALFIMGRSDIAEAVDATGVLLTKQGVPLAVARRMLGQRSLLLGCLVSTVKEAGQIAANGASFLCFHRQGEIISKTELQKAKSNQRGGAIPVLTILETEVLDGLELSQYLDSEVDGVIIKQTDLRTLCTASGTSSIEEIATVVKDLLLNDTNESVNALEYCPKKETLPPRRLLLTENCERLLSCEKETLNSCLETLQTISPELEEIFLLEGAIRQLDELFLVVVVGEYNSGKSSVINALLGSRFLDEGILPTTNEISLLRFSELNSMTSTTLPDGVVERKLPAPLLQEINIVDTPGTNVVLERQQRLTEEYVPRADMVLFVLSCDRPFTESEVQFLEYIRKWGKKVIFVVNKIDILYSEQDVEKVAAFISQNARRFLNLTEAFVWPVSARKALEAKLSVGGSSFGGLYPSLNSDDLDQDPRWISSRFSELESFMSEFFSSAEGAASAESVRLKLQTPLYVADALLDASKRQLANERIAAENDVAASRQVSAQLMQFESDMRRDSGIQQNALKSVLEKLATRAESFIDETLLVSNFFTLRGYLSDAETGLGPSKAVAGFSSGVMGDVVSEIKELRSQHVSWTEKNCSNQMSNYQSFAEKCAEQFKRSLESIMKEHEIESIEKKSSKSSNTVKKKHSTVLNETQLISSAMEKSLHKLNVAMVIQQVFRNPGIGIQLSEILVESEIRDAVNATGGTAIAAVSIGFILTLILPSTFEDILAVSISLLIGYVALLNLPLRRGEIKSKIRKLRDLIGGELMKEFDDQLSEALEDTTLKINKMINPLEIMFNNELDRVIQNEKLRSEVESNLNKLKREILNIE
eukprot:g8188.t1